MHKDQVACVTAGVIWDSCPVTPYTGHHGREEGGIGARKLCYVRRDWVCASVLSMAHVSQYDELNAGRYGGQAGWGLHCPDDGASIVAWFSVLEAICVWLMLACMVVLQNKFGAGASLAAAEPPFCPSSCTIHLLCCCVLAGIIWFVWQSRCNPRQLILMFHKYWTGQLGALCG